MSEPSKTFVLVCEFGERGSEFCTDSYRYKVLGAYTSIRTATDALVSALMANEKGKGEKKRTKEGLPGYSGEGFDEHRCKRICRRSRHFQILELISDAAPHPSFSESFHETDIPVKHWSYKLTAKACYHDQGTCKFDPKDGFLLTRKSTACSNVMCGIPMKDTTCHSGAGSDRQRCHSCSEQDEGASYETDSLRTLNEYIAQSLPFDIYSCLASC